MPQLKNDSTDSIWKIDKIVIVSKSEFQLPNWAAELSCRIGLRGSQEQLITLQLQMAI